MKRLKIDNQVPFASSIYWWLKLHQSSSKNLIRESHRYDLQYLAWQEVRKERNPFFFNGTGFEGYLIGDCQSPGEALDQILEICQEMLDNSARLHRFEARFLSRLMQTLVGEDCDPRSMYEWNALFGAALGRLRCTATRNRLATLFRRETYREIQHLPAIDYRENLGSVQQEYFLAGHSIADSYKLLIGSQILRSSNQDAWLVAQSIGKFGHPLVREYLRWGVHPFNAALV